MRLTRLKTENFRNLAAVDVTPAPGVNVIYGENAQGKTNLIEAIYLLTGQKSFRAAKESDYLRFGQEVARIEAEFTAALAYGSKKLAWLNGVECAPSELTGEFLAVVFSPGELALIQEGPSERRAFLDGAISQVMPRYMTTLAAMSRILLQRNTLITDMQKSGNAAMMEPLLETTSPASPPRRAPIGPMFPPPRAKLISGRRWPRPAVRITKTTAPPWAPTGITWR